MENPFLEIAGLDLGNGLIMGDFFPRDEIALVRGPGFFASSGGLVLSRWTRKSGSHGI